MLYLITRALWSIFEVNVTRRIVVKVNVKDRLAPQQSAQQWSRNIDKETNSNALLQYQDGSTGYGSNHFQLSELPGTNISPTGKHLRKSPSQPPPLLHPLHSSQSRMFPLYSTDIAQ
jgi:hypothetical protein